MAAEQPRFFEKNKADFSNSNVVVTASQGQDFEIFARNRSQISAWVTTESVDADNTTYEINFGDIVEIDTIILMRSNFKNYTVKYDVGGVWTDFSTAIAVTNNTTATKFHQFTAVQTTKVKLTITGTMTANQDKRLYEFVVTKEIGQFIGWPEITDVVRSRNRQITKMISGKELVREQIGFTMAKMKFKVYRNTTDLTLIETLYASNDGFHMWMCGGDEAQFYSVREGYRLMDLPLVKLRNEWKPNWYNGVYKLGFENIVLEFVEVVS